MKNHIAKLFLGLRYTLLAFCLLPLSLAQAESLPDPGAESAPLEILVAGGSGRTGRYLVQDLLDQGLAFKALTRSRERALARWGEALRDAEWVEGDVRDRLRMREVMADISHVICVIGSRDLAGPNSAEFVDFGGVRNLVDAAVEHGVRHFVLLTAIGTTDPAHPFNRISGGALEWRFKGEEYLRASGLSYTIVRPGGLNDEPPGQQGVLITQGDQWRDYLGSTLSRADLARVLLEAAVNPAAQRVTVEVVNDPELAPDDNSGMFSSLVPD